MRRIGLLLIPLLLAFSCGQEPAFQNGLDPTATPLVSVDPYFSLWSFGKELNADVTRHWTGRKQPVLAALRVDGKVYRVLGCENARLGVPEGRKRPHLEPDSSYLCRGPEVFVDAAVQTGHNVLPTRSLYSFDCGPVELRLTFTSPLLPGRLELLSRPVGYAAFDVSSKDGRPHEVQLYFEASPRLAMNFYMVPMKLETGSADGVDFARAGTVSQDVLGRAADDIRIDWGWFYLASAGNKGQVAVVEGVPAREAFAANGTLAARQGNLTTPDFVQDDLALACTCDFGKAVRNGSRTILLAYDDIYSINYLGQPLRPYWNRSGSNTITREIAAAAAQERKVGRLCASFDKALLKEALEAGGKEYADLCAAVFRQAIAAHKLVEGPDGELFFFSKENFSNGSIGTVDVSYPSVPLLLLYNNELAKGLLNHIYRYAESDAWPNDWAPHDVGRYPQALGQNYGNTMPLEECGNMLLLTAAVVAEDGDAGYASRHWETLSKWAAYALAHGQHPENQLCTDDFAGRLANNANLSAKAILGVAAYGKMAAMLGKDGIASFYLDSAARMASIWKEEAFDGDHYRLSFDTPDTWSLKYNLVWDKLLGLDIFDPAIMEAEIPYYLSKENLYGVPLDCRAGYTKTDWVMWVASMAPDMETFQRFVHPLYRFYTDSVLPGPLSDWTETETPRSHQMRGRSVIGGFYMKMYSDRIKDKRP